MPVCSEMPWGGPFHGPHGCGRARGMGRGGFGFGGCGRGAFGGWGARGMGPWGFGGHHEHRHGPYGHHRGHHHGHHHGPPPPPPPPHHGCGGPHGHFQGPSPPPHHHGCPPPPPPPHHGVPHPPPPPPHHGFGGPHDHHHGPPPPPHHGPPCGGPRGRFGGCRGGMGGGPMRGAWARGRGGCGPCGRGRMGRPWMWGPAGTGPRHWRCRPGAFDAPFDDALLVTMLLNFDLPVFSRDGETGEDVLPSAPEQEPQRDQDQAQESAQDQEANQEPAETNVIRIDTRRFRPEDIRVSFTDGQLRVTASRTEETGEEVTLTRSAALRRGSKVTAKLAADGYLYIRAEDPATTARNVTVEIAEEKQE